MEQGLNNPYLGGGYQPTQSNLDPSNPPQGGSESIVCGKGSCCRCLGKSKGKRCCKDKK